MENKDASSDDRESIDPISIIKPRLLLAEDKDCKYFLIHFTKKLGLEEIQIEEFGGKDNLRNHLEQYIIHPDFPIVTSLGIVRDAETDPDPFARVVSALKRIESEHNIGLKPPKRPLQPSDGHPRVTIMILPKDGEEGALEDLCLKSVAQDKSMTCVEQYMQCLKQLQEKEGIQMPKNVSKAKLHAFLASREVPGKPIGQSVAKGYLPADSKAFDDVKSFLELVALKEKVE
jgi:hypothetical protein